MADRLKEIQDRPFKSVIYISIPLILILFLNTLYGIVDVYWIGFLGQSAIIAVGYIANVSYAFNKIGDGIARSSVYLLQIHLVQRITAEQIILHYMGY